MKGFLALVAADIAVAAAAAAGNAAAAVGVAAAGHADSVAVGVAVAAAENGFVAAAAVADPVLVEVAHAEGLCCLPATHHWAGMCRQSSSCLVLPHT